MSWRCIPYGNVTSTSFTLQPWRVNRVLFLISTISTLLAQLTFSRTTRSALERRQIATGVVPRRRGHRKRKLGHKRVACYPPSAPIGCLKH